MIFIIIVAIIIIIFIIYYFRKEKLTNDYSCGCVFDLDDTLTCGQERAKEAINYCKSKGCKISINTARPTKWYSDIKLSQLDLSENDFNDDFYCTEVFDRNNNFKYTELFLKLGSDYRVVLEEFKIGEFKSFHEILKIFK